jgi:PAS domain S-box-containing protein
VFDSKKRFNSIRARLFLLIGIVLFPTILIQTVIYKDRYKLRQSDELQANMEVVRGFSMAFGEFVKDVLHQEIVIGLALASGHIPKEGIQTLLELSAAEHQSILSYSWVDPNGSIIHSSFSGEVGVDFNSYHFFNELNAGGEAHVSDLFLLQESGSPVFTISRSLRDALGTNLGFVVAVVEPGLLDTSLAFKREGGGAVGLWDRNGRLVLRYPKLDFSWEERDLSGLPFLQGALKGEEYTVEEAVGIDGVPRAYALTPIDTIGWFASASRPTAEIYSMVQGRLYRHAGMLLAAILISLPLAAYAAHTISSPVRRLRAKARGGEEDFREGVGGPVEVQDLALDLHRMTNDLRESEKKFRAVFEGAIEPIYIHDFHGRFFDANSQGYNLLGYSKDELMGMTIADVDANADSASEHLRVLLKEGSRSFETELVRKDGTPVPVEINSHVIQYGNETAVLGVVRDITKRKRAEEALRNSEARYRTLVQNANSAIIRLNADGTVTLFNEFAQSFFGYSEEEAVGRHISFIVPDKETTGTDLSGLFQDVVANPERYVNFVNENVRKDGSRVWMAWTNKPIFDAEGKVIEILAVGSDITDRKRAEEALRQSMVEVKLREREARKRGRILDAMMDYIPMGITIADAPDVTIRRVSRYGKELIGRSSEQIEGIPVDKHVEQWDIYHADGFTRASNEELPLTRATQKGEQVREELWVLGNQDGKKIPIVCNAAPIRDEHGDIVGGVIGWQDITELLNQKEKLKTLASQLEDRIRERTLELEQANRAKDEFLANMSHEIRTPLTGIMGLTELSLQNVDLSGELSENLQMIRYSAQSLNVIVNDILDFSAIEAKRFVIRPEVFSPREELAMLIGGFEERAGSKGLSFTFQIDDEVPERVVSDPARVRQILINLLNNALKFTLEGGVELSVRRPDPHHLSFTVSDTGIGIPENRIDDLFNSFTQLDDTVTKRFGGTGLGLALSRNLAELLAGTIEVATKEGAGSVFTLTIAVEIPEYESSIVPDASPSLSTLRPLRILLVEDNPVNRLFLQRALNDAGHTVEGAENGLRALEWTSRDDFDLILMDIQMPEMNGIDATRRIRSGGNGRADIPIIALTAYAMKGDREKFLDNGMDGYVTKPVDFGELARTILEVCGEEMKNRQRSDTLAP